MLQLLIIFGIIMIIGSVAGVFLEVSTSVALAYLGAVLGLMLLFSVMSVYTAIEDGLLAFIVALYINSAFHLHPVFNILIFFALFGAFYMIFEVLWRTVRTAKGWIFSIAYLAVCWVSVYKGMPEIDNIWKTFFYVILVVFVIAARWTSLNKAGEEFQDNVVRPKRRKKTEEYSFADDELRSKAREIAQRMIDETEKDSAKKINKNL